jgi:hypothetical protein
MKKVEETYGQDFFAHRFDEIGWRGSIMCDTIQGILHPATLVDVGCGIGDLVEAFRLRGVAAWGVEGSEFSFPYRRVRKSLLLRMDLRKPQKLERNVSELALCFEVAEHIEPEYTEIFFDNLVMFSDSILFSSFAGESSHAVGHVNQNPMSFWCDQFKRRGYTKVEGIGDRMRYEWSDLTRKRGIRAIADTIELFRRNSK